MALRRGGLASSPDRQRQLAKAAVSQQIGGLDVRCEKGSVKDVPVETGTVGVPPA